MHLFSGLIFLVFSFVSFGQQLIINEVSQGTGSSEYVEFVVIGNATCVTPVPCIDLRSVIIDDNNGYFAPGTGTGIASGAVRFGNIAFWQCVPQGTFIVIYNEQEPNVNLPADDVSLTDGNCRLVIPASSSLLEKTTVSPNTTVATYPPDASWVTGGTWSPLAMSNTNDSFQIPNLGINGTPLHSVSWGNNTNGAIIYFSGSAAAKVFSFTNTISNDWNLQDNWTSGNVPADETPGFANNTQNDSWISTMNPECGINPGMTVSINGVNESCVNTCDGSATTVVSNGIPSYTYLWSNGAISANLTDLCPGTYSVEVTGANGCSAVQTILIAAGNPISNATINPAGPFLATSAAQQLSVVNAGGVWSANCGACLSSTGLFNPQIAGVGIWEVCYQLGSGNCSDTECISIEVTQDCTPQLTSETITICPGDSAYIFGNWEQNSAIYSQSYIDVNGCDSSHVVTLNSYSADPVFEIVFLCEFDSILVFNEWFYSDTLVQRIFQTTNGCDYLQTVQIQQENCVIEPSVIYMPNVFTPNGDMINDTFLIQVLGGQVEEGFIFNRWGNLVYTFDESNISWDSKDSKSGQPVQDGVYTYLIYFKPAEMPREKYHGFVTVIR